MMPKFKGKTKPKLHKPSMETVMRWMVTLLLGFVVLLPVFAGVTRCSLVRVGSCISSSKAAEARKSALIGISVPSTMMLSGNVCHEVI